MRGNAIDPFGMPEGKHITSDTEYVARLLGAADRVSGSDTSITLRYGNFQVMDMRALGAHVSEYDSAMTALDAVFDAFGPSRFRGTLGATVGALLPRNPFCEESGELATEIRFSAYHGGLTFAACEPATYVADDNAWRFTGPARLLRRTQFEAAGESISMPPPKRVGSIFMFDINGAWPHALAEHCNRFTSIPTVDVSDCGIYLIEIDGQSRTTNMPIVPHKNQSRCEWAPALSGQIWADSLLISELMANGYGVTVLRGFASMPDESGSNAVQAVSRIAHEQTRKSALRALCGRVAMRPHTSKWIQDDGMSQGRMLAGHILVNTEPSPFPRCADPVWSAYMCSATNQRVVRAARSAESAGFRLVFCDTDCIMVYHPDFMSATDAARRIGLDFGTAPGQWGIRLENTNTVVFGPKGYVSKQRTALAVCPHWATVLDLGYYGFASENDT